MSRREHGNGSEDKIFTHFQANLYLKLKTFPLQTLQMSQKLSQNCEIIGENERKWACSHDKGL